MRRFHTCVCSLLHLPADEQRVIERLIADSRAGRSVFEQTDLTIVPHHDGYMIHVGVIEDHPRRPDNVTPVLWRLLGHALDEGASWLSFDREEIPCSTFPVYPGEAPLDPPERVAMCCRTCGGRDVMRDAWAGWDERSQAWTLGETYEKDFCNTCESDTTLVELPLVSQSADLAA